MSVYYVIRLQLTDAEVSYVGGSYATATRWTNDTDGAR